MKANRLSQHLILLTVCAYVTPSLSLPRVCEEEVGAGSLFQQRTLAVYASAYSVGKTRQAGSCDFLAEEACAAAIGCGFSHGLCSPRIAWLHFMKTGSSLGTALAHFANASLPRTAHIPSGKNASDPEDTTIEGQQGEPNFFHFKYNASFWFRNVFRHPSNPGQHRPVSADDYEVWKGNLFGMFRDPARRALSSWHYFAEGKGNLSQFAINIRGQQASMLSLGDAAEQRKLCEIRNLSTNCSNSEVPNVTLAIERLEGFAFIGLTEEFDLSICLFHLMFGGECFDVEFFNMRPGAYKKEEEADRLESELAMLRAQGDPWDTPFYEAASRRFWSDVEKYDATRTTCRSTCPSAASFQDDA
eukprot:TRINITY_DN71_c0_g2_i4.p1 TRINITY_DN71_c0_g2~~TRINITY_DN71_c0_g2_i4.p1  ORF type:complete len:359 (-),score=53.55 TRINITY_DN71_c0_g2_i4:24-1100(-)